MEQNTPFHGLNLVFFGSGDFATLVFEELLKIGVNFKALVTLPPRPKGRGRKLKDPDVKQIALKHSIPVFQPENPNSPEFIEELKQFAPHFIVLADYGKILKSELLQLPRFYPLNIHPSLLPEYRGAAPIERAMMDCRKSTGVSVMVMDEGLDTGPIVLQERLEIGKTEIKTELMERMAKIGARLARNAIEVLLAGRLQPVPQSGIPSYAKKITSYELWINWKASAEKIKCKINALSLKPGAKAKFGNLLVKLLRADVLAESARQPGKIQIRDERLFVEAEDFLVEILEIQPQGKRAMGAAEFVRGYKRKIL